MESAKCSIGKLCVNLYDMCVCSCVVDFESQHWGQPKPVDVVNANRGGKENWLSDMAKFIVHASWWDHQQTSRYLYLVQCTNSTLGNIVLYS